MKILGIETSCDETAAAVVENGEKIISTTIASSVEFHKKTGGIIPEVAAREQIRWIIPVIEKTIAKTKNIDALAVTVGPGLIGSLLVGVETAKTLSFLWQKPIIPINHLVAHVYANWLNPQKPKFPLISLIVSGGHTDLVLMQHHQKIIWLGGTKDDAAGECFDKCARALGLDYPGGPAIATEADKFKDQNSQFQIKLPRPIIEEKNFDFSFSGLKTAVIREIEKLKNQKLFNALSIRQLSFEIQEAITDVLVEKTLRAVEKFKVKSILLSGGVAANKRLQEKFKTSPLISGYQLLTPPSFLCTDNAAMVAACAYFNYSPKKWQKIKISPGLLICDKI